MKTYLVSLFLLFSVSFLNAQVIRVPADQTSIQAAIEAASEGDTVLVDEGLYYENINFLGKAITVTSHFILDADTSHISKTIIDGSQAIHADRASVVRMISGEDTTSVLMGFTITGGEGSRLTMKWGGVSYPGLWGGGIAINNSGGLISHNIIENNNLGPRADLDEIYGGGLTAIVNNNHSLIVRNNIMSNNTVTGYYAYGGGAFFAGGRIIFEKNTVSENTCFASSQLGPSGIFWANYGNEGVINEVVFRNNLITKNRGYSEINYGICGALSIGLTIGEEAVQVYNNVISDNYSEGNGGGIYLYKTRATVFNNTIWNNEATRSGNSVEMVGPSDIVMFNNIIRPTANNNQSDFAFKEFGTSTFELWYNILKEPIENDKINALRNNYEEPVFLSDSYDLAENSPGIGWGVESLELDGIQYFAPPRDMKDEIRPNSTDKYVDLGALESSYNKTKFSYDTERVILVPDEQDDIQSAINIADEGDTVLVDEGLYYENINFLGKAITVASHFILDADTSCISRTIIDGSQAIHADRASTVRMISGEDTTSVLMGFTITGGKGSKLTYKWGAESTEGLWGGGIAINNSGGLISHNIIANNNLESRADLDEFLGGGLTAIVNNNHSLIVRNNVIRLNSVSGSYAGGGGAFLAGGRIIFEQNEVSNNELFATGPSGGAGIFWVNFNNPGVINDVVFRNNIITDNKGYSDTNAGWGGGMILNFNLGVDGAQVYNNVISNNYIDGKAGGMYFYSTRATVFNNTIWNNKSKSGSNSIEGLSPSDVVMFNNIIWSDIENNYPDFTLDQFESSSSLISHNILKDTIHEFHAFVQGNKNYRPRFIPDSYNLAPNSPGAGWGVEMMEFNGNSYFARVTDLNGDIRPHPIDSLVDMGAIESRFKSSTVDIAENDFSISELRIFPNPSKDRLIIEVLKSGRYYIEITSLNGQQIFSTVMEGTSHQIDLSEVPDGVYLMTVRSKEFVTTRKIIKLRN